MRYRFHFIRKNFLAYTFDDAYRQAHSYMIHLESTLDTPREHIRIYSLTLPSVDITEPSQCFVASYVVHSKYKVDFQVNQKNKFNSILL